MAFADVDARCPSGRLPTSGRCLPIAGARAGPGSVCDVTQSPEQPSPSRIRISRLAELKREGRRFAMLTAYDRLTAEVFDEAGVEVLLVGDSAANVVYGESSTLPVTVDELVPLARAVVRGARHALVVADLPFGSYQASVADAVRTAVRFMKETGAAAVKLEGGRRFQDHVRAIVEAGIPVMGHIGFTPQSEHQLGGYRVQGRDRHRAEELVDDALAVADAGAFAIVLEMVTAPVARRIGEVVQVPTIGIGAGPDTDGQVLVWQDMAGLTTGRTPRFVKRYADLRATLGDAAARYAAEVRSGAFPAAEHTFEE